MTAVLAFPSGASLGSSDPAFDAYVSTWVSIARLLVLSFALTLRAWGVL